MVAGGVSHAALARPDKLSEFKNLADRTYRRLKQNQGKSGYFGHLGTTKSVAGLLRGRVGSFADQIYPIYGMSKFAMAFHMDTASTAALDCAKAICRAQGEMGQWWWLYDSNSGPSLQRISRLFRPSAGHGADGSDRGGGSNRA